MKRAGSSTSSKSEAKRRRVSHDTFVKWQREYDREWQTLRPNQRRRKAYRKRVISSSGTDDRSVDSDSTNSDPDTFILDDWENWMIVILTDFLVFSVELVVM